jgi:hypothetical protein
VFWFREGRGGLRSKRWWLDLEEREVSEITERIL